MADEETFSNVQPVEETFSNVTPISSPNTGFWSHVGQSIRSMAPDQIPSFTDVLKAAGESSLGPGAQALKALHSAATEYAAARERGHGVPYSAAAGASTAVGVSPERMEQAAEQGDTAGVLGEAAVPTALAVSPLGLEAVGKTVAPVGTAFKGAVADMKPAIVSELDRTHTLGGRVAKVAAETILPDSPEAIAARQRAVEETEGAGINRAIKMQDVEARRVAAQAERQQRAQARQVRTQPPTEPTSPVVSSPSAPIESEGRPATWTNQTVLARSSQGDMTAIQQARLRGLTLPENANFVGNKAATVTPSVGARRLVMHFDANGNPIGPVPPTLPGGPADFANRMTLNPVGDTGARPLTADQFESSFGPEYQEVGDLAEWETGNREGVKPKKKVYH